MSHDDPFAGLDHANHTIVKPTPGGARPRPTAAAAPSAPRAPDNATLLARSGLNPLERAASTLLILLTRLKNTAHPADLEGLRRQVIEEVKRFENQAHSLGVNQETLVAARYVLCTALDEMALNTPWGSTSAWRQQSLLITFHKEAWGGEKFFLLLDKLVKDPHSNLALLELMYICLSLGFQGRYQVLEGGYNRLEELRERLFRILSAQRGEFERELSPRWRGVVDQRNPLLRYVPLWVVSALASAILLAVFIGFSVSLNRASDPVFAALHAIGKEVATPLAPPPSAPIPQAATASNLRGFLEPEIRAGLVEVKEAPDSTTVLIRGDGLFESASSVVKPAYYPLLTRIADALKSEPGQVLVTGHTDNIPIRTLRFPSNWHLSQQRAEAVVKLLAAAIATPSRFSAEGRADTEPLVANDSADNRARNRRVEITLLARVSKP